MEEIDKEHRNASFEMIKNSLLKLNRLKNIIILDIGAGDNYLKNKFTEIGIGWIGMDIIPNDGISIKGKLEDIPFHNHTIDVALCSHSFEHTTNPIKTLKEIHRILKPNGILYIVAPVYCDIQLFAMSDEHYFVLTDKQITVLLQKNGFIINENELIKRGENIKDHSYFISAIKM